MTNPDSDIANALIAYLEQMYWQSPDGRYPTQSKIAEDLGISQTRTSPLMKDPQIIAQLKKRGLPDPTVLRRKAVGGTRSRNSTLLTELQVIGANLVLNTSDKRSKNVKLKSIGCSTADWNAWLKEPAFTSYIKSELERRFKLTEIDAKLALASLVEGGDLQAIKYYHELTGIYRPGSEQLLNLSLLLAQLMEILAKYLTVEVLHRVAEEFDSVVQGTIGPKPIEVEWNSPLPTPSKTPTELDLREFKW